MTIIGCIPARHSSTRFPGKPLAPILGVPMIVRVCQGAAQSKKLTDLIVVTDDQSIHDVVVKAGFKARMTSPECETGTDRIYEALLQNGKISAEIVVNIQGDEPLVKASMIDALVEPLIEDSSLEMSTLAHALEPGDLESMNAVKVISNIRGDAVYFSRFAIPYSRNGVPDKEQPVCLRHIGLYGYRGSFLQKFCKAPPAEMERAEALEQLRALHLGARIKVVKVSQKSWGVDTPEDLAKIEKILKEQP